MTDRLITVPASDVVNVCDEALREFSSCTHCPAKWTKFTGTEMWRGTARFCDDHAPPEAVDGDYAFVVRAAHRLLTIAKETP